MSAGKILAQARIDAAKFTEAGGFQVDVALTTPDGNTTVNIQGTGSGRWVTYDNDGNNVNAQKNSIRIAESTLKSLNYPVRSGTSGQVKLRAHKISYLDNNGNLQKYVIEEVYPNANTGLIICMLGNSE
jgi:hypothetical protein